MTSPVAWRWNPYGNQANDPAPPPRSPAAQSTAPSYFTSSPSAGPYSTGYIPASLRQTDVSPAGLVLLPQDLAAEGRSHAQTYGIPKEGEEVDARAEVIRLSKGIRDLDASLDSLKTAPIDVEAAKKRVTAADDKQTQFFTDVKAKLSPEQALQLKPLSDAVKTSEGDKRSAAEAEYVKAMDGMLTPDQRKTLLTLQRNSEDARVDLRGQQIGQRIRDAEAGKAPAPGDPKGATPQERLSVALADGRTLLAQKEQLVVDRKLQDIYTLVMTPENRAKLAPKQQALFDAHQKLQADPKNEDLKKRFKDAQAAFDDAFHGLVDPKDREVIQGFEARQRHLQSVAGTLGDEATGERNFYEQRAATVTPEKPTALQLQEARLAQHQFELIKHNRSMRDLALRSGAAPDDDDLKKQLDEAMVTGLRKNSDLQVEARQLGYDAAVSKHQEASKPTQVPFANNNDGIVQLASYNGSPAAGGVTPTQQAVNDAKALLDEAKDHKQKLEEELKPPEPKKGFWERALDIAMGVGQIIGGIALAAFAGWTGIGAVAGGAIVVDGLFRLGHSISDAANGTVTDTPQSRLMQNLGVSRDAANNTDMAINLIATVPVAAGGAALTIVKSSSMLLKGSGLLSGAVVLDGAQAGTRSIITNEAVAPFAVQQLQNAGLSQTQANYVVALGTLAGVGGLAGAAKVRSPGTVNSEFMTFGTRRPTRDADAPAPDVPDVPDAPDAPTVPDAPDGPDGSAVAAAPDAPDVPDVPDAPDVSAVAATPDAPDVPDAPDTSAATSDGPSRVADWHTRGASKDLRTQIAREVLGPDATPRAVRQLANTMRGDPLVVLKTVGDDGSQTLVGAATVRANSTGHFGRDLQGNRIDPKSAEIKPLLGEGEIKQQVIAAGVEGVKEFTTQRTAFWQTQDPDDASGVSDANLKQQRVRRNAPEQLAQLPEDQRPWGTTQALDRGNGTQQQLRELSKIPEGDRINWPAGTRDLRYDVSFDRPLTALGQQWLGKLLHPMHKDSYLGQFNLKTNPVNYLLSKLRPQSTDPVVVGRYDPPANIGGPTRVATHYKPGTVPDKTLQTLAEQEVNANAAFGDKTSFNNHPAERLVALAKAKLAKLDLVVLTETDPLTGQQTILGNAAITPNFKGFRGADSDVFPWLGDTQYKPGTTYLGHVFAKPGVGAGNQVVHAASEVARNNGARHFDFLTQWGGAQKLYERMGAHPNGTAAPDGAELPMTVYEARFGTKAGEYLLDISDPRAVGRLHPDLKTMINESGGSPEVLQAKLNAAGDDAFQYVAKAGDGALLTRYTMDYSPTASSWRVSAKWAMQDTAWWTQRILWEPIRKPVVGGMHGIGSGFRWANERVNPYSLTAFEPGTVRSALRNTGYASAYGVKQGWTTYKGAVIDAAALQAATGNVYIVRNDDRAIRPFNGLPGSDSVAVYFPWTGTLISGWVTGPNVRGPAPIDDTGLQPLFRASAPMTDPKGPKGAGALTAARAVVSEANLGIRWFGNNNGVSAVTAASVRLAPINVNGRVDVPIQAGGPRGVQVPHSFTWFMPSVSHAFYAGQGGFIVRNLHVTLSGASQTSVFSSAVRANAYRSGDHWMLGSKTVTTGTGFFLTLNPAYGEPEFQVR